MLRVNWKPTRDHHSTQSQIPKPGSLSINIFSQTLTYKHAFKYELGQGGDSLMTAPPVLLRKHIGQCAIRNCFWTWREQQQIFAASTTNRMIDKFVLNCAQISGEQFALPKYTNLSPKTHTVECYLIYCTDFRTTHRNTMILRQPIYNKRLRSNCANKIQIKMCSFHMISTYS